MNDDYVPRPPSDHRPSSPRDEAPPPPPSYQPDVADRVRAPLRRPRARLDRRPRDPARRHLLDAQRGRQQLVHGGDPHPDGRLRLPPAARHRPLAARTEGAPRGRPHRGRRRDSGLIRDDRRRLPGLRPDLTRHRPRGRGAGRRPRRLHRRALVLDAGRQRRHARRPGGTDAGRNRDRRRLDRLRRPRPRRQRRRPALAALELAGARRLRRLGAAADRLDLRQRIHHLRGRHRSQRTRPARPRGPGRVLGPLRRRGLRLRAAEPRGGEPPGVLLAAAPLQQRLGGRRRLRRHRRRFDACPERLDLRLRRSPTSCSAAPRSASASIAKSARC